MTATILDLAISSMDNYLGLSILCNFNCPINYLYFGSASC